MQVDPASQGNDAAAGKPVQSSAGRPSRAPITICAVMTSAGRACDFTAAFQPA